MEPRDTDIAKFEPDDVMGGIPSDEKVQRIENALRRLPPFQREIFIAIRFEDLSYDDIAQHTGLTIAEVEQAFAQSLLNLARNFAGPQRHWWQRLLG